MFSCWSAPSTKDAYRLSWASLIITILAAVAGIGLYGNTGSSLCLVYGLENCVDFLSSVVVLWRFFAPSTIDANLENRLRRREKRASIAISFILFVLGFSVIIAALKDFSRGIEDSEELEAVEIISFVSLFVFGGMSLFKFRYASALDSASLYKDGVCSLIGTILAGALFVNSLIIEHEPNAWVMDPLVALGAGIGAIAISLHSLWIAKKRDNLPIFTKAWWLTSQGDGTDERSGRPLGPDDFGKGAVELKPQESSNIEEVDGENDIV